MKTWHGESRARLNGLCRGELAAREVGDLGRCHTGARQVEARSDGMNERADRGEFRQRRFFVQNTTY
jgi:hypothetical protein